MRSLFSSGSTSDPRARVQCGVFARGDLRGRPGVVAIHTRAPRPEFAYYPITTRSPFEVMTPSALIESNAAPCV